MNFCFTCSSTPLQYITHHNTIRMHLHHYTRSLGVVQTVHLPPFVDIVCLHLTNMAENMFLHNIMFWALVALGEFSHRTPHIRIYVLSISSMGEIFIRNSCWLLESILLSNRNVIRLIFHKKD